MGGRTLLRLLLTISISTSSIAPSVSLREPMEGPLDPEWPKCPDCPEVDSRSWLMSMAAELPPACSCRLTNLAYTPPARTQAWVTTLNGMTDREIDRQTDRQTETWANTQADRQTDRNR
jgi:hypothetical protein